MTIDLHLISGMAIGLEYVSPEALDEDEHCVVLDLGVFRFMFFWDAA